MLLLLLCALLFLPSQASLSVELSGGQEECFVIRAPADEPAILTGNYDCLDDELDPALIRVTLTQLLADRRKVLYASPKDVSEDAFRVQVDKGAGRFVFCVRNYHASEQYLVGFNVRVSALPRALESELEGPDEERSLALVSQAEALNEEWDTLMDHFAYLATREVIHKQLSETILSRVMGWVLVEAVVLISIAVGQVLYLRKFLEKTRYL